MVMEIVRQDNRVLLLHDILHKTKLIVSSEDLKAVAELVVDCLEYKEGSYVLSSNFTKVSSCFIHEAKVSHEVKRKRVAQLLHWSLLQLVIVQRII